MANDCKTPCMYEVGFDCIINKCLLYLLAVSHCPNWVAEPAELMKWEAWSSIVQSNAFLWFACNYTRIAPSCWTTKKEWLMSVGKRKTGYCSLTCFNLWSITARSSSPKTLNVLFYILLWHEFYQEVLEVKHFWNIHPYL